MTVRIEQNWKWSSKIFQHTLCVVSSSDETTKRGICLTSNKNLHSASGGGGGGNFRLEIIIISNKHCYLSNKTPIFKEEIAPQCNFWPKLPPPDAECRFLLEVKHDALANKSVIQRIFVEMKADP